MQARRIAGRVLFYLLVAAIIVYTVFPFYWAIVSSLKAGSALFQVEFWPANPAWDNYAGVFRGQPFARNILKNRPLKCQRVHSHSSLPRLAKK